MNVVSCSQLQPNDHCHSPQCSAQCRSHPCGTFRNCQDPWWVGHGWLQFNLENITSIAALQSQVSIGTTWKYSTRHTINPGFVPAPDQAGSCNELRMGTNQMPTVRTSRQTWCCNWHWHLPKNVSYHVQPGLASSHLSQRLILIAAQGCHIAWAGDEHNLHNPSSDHMTRIDGRTVCNTCVPTKRS